MSDLFISYSREDTDFVRQLFDRLNTLKREAWVDWQGIDYSTTWWEEICAGIEGADNFVLVISPDALMSVYCQRGWYRAHLGCECSGFHRLRLFTGIARSDRI